jgi:hypothetical protein
VGVFVLLAAAFPFALMLLLLLMERVEKPLRDGDRLGSDLVSFLDNARPDEIESFVSEGYASALDRYWRRRRRPVDAARVLAHH